MQVITRAITSLVLVLTLSQPSFAERPRPLGWALDAMRTGNWDTAAQLAARDGTVAADVVEWHRLRAGRGSYAEYMAFLSRRGDWPGEAYLRKRAEDEVIKQSDAEVLGFFNGSVPQTPRAVLSHAAALMRAGKTGEAEANLVMAWRSMPMNTTSQSLFLAAHEGLLKTHHAARLEEMLWQRQHEEAQQMFDLVGKDERAVAQARIALQKRSSNASALVQALPAALADDPGVTHDRFEWRIRAGMVDDAKTLMLERSASADKLGQPAKWGNRRRALARGEMRSGDKRRAYEMAAQHHLPPGSDYADLEWLAGYIALRFLDDPQRAYQHFLHHDAAVESPISQGRAGYWQGLALEAMGDAEGAAKAFAEGAKFQSAFYGLLAAEKAGLPFDETLKGAPPATDWRSSALARAPLFEAGMLLQASGELNLAELFWTHLADQLMQADLELLGQAAIDAGQPHLAVMIGKRAARRGITVAAPYYALHDAIELDLAMAPEMVLAIARRESEFDPVVQSGVGARGLMQIMPATGREIAAGLGISDLHTTDRLIEDPDYNALLGAKYLSTLAGRFDGNVMMVSAGYNAGPSRPPRWMAAYGDPRKGEVSAVDWIEMIPFRETQNYVMRVTESLPIYRARLGKDPLPIPFSEELTGSTLLPFAPKGE
ncbi:MAG: lytic transglycosylase domain-containing protein [Sulfitobacter sp.]